MLPCESTSLWATQLFGPHVTRRALEPDTVHHLQRDGDGVFLRGSGVGELEEKDTG